MPGRALGIYGIRQMQLTVAFAIILIGPWLLGRASRAVGLPSILGMLLFGVLWASLSGGVVDWLPRVPAEIDAVSGLATTVALIVILLRAGLGIQKSVLARVGPSALRMGFLPCLIETVAATAAFVWILEVDLLTGLLGGSILAAVSPAVVVPSMLELRGRGLERMPTLVLAGASIDDAVAITIFTAALGVASRPGPGGASGLMAARVLLVLPLSIASGVALGVALGFLASWFFSRRFAHIRATEKALLMVMLSLLVVELGNHLPVAALLAVMTIGFVLLERAEPVAHEVAHKLSKLWVPAEILLFVFIGLQVDLTVAIAGGARGLAIIGLGLVGRGLGVFLSLLPDRALSSRERVFALVAYLPKATVQAALGAIPLSLGLPGGPEILAVSVLAIIVTAPVGLVLIRIAGAMLLEETNA